MHPSCTVRPRATAPHLPRVSRRVARTQPASRPSSHVGTNDDTTYTYLASFQRAVRARRGDDARAERCLRVGCDKTALRSRLAASDFPLVLPDRENYLYHRAADAQKVQRHSGTSNAVR